MSVLAMREALRQAMAEEMRRDPTVFLMGEEVAQYDGAYKVSQGMLAEFGPERIVDTPIAENGFAGLGIGAAMAGMRPIIEFMTFNFSLVAYDQVVNNAARIYQMSAGQYRVPIVFRGPNGAAENLGSQHSTAVESIYAHFPGLKVVAPSTPADAKGLLKAAIRDDNPVLFLESEMMYGFKGEVPDGEHLVPLGLADVKRDGTDVVCVTWASRSTTLSPQPRPSPRKASRRWCSTCGRCGRSITTRFSAPSRRRTGSSWCRRASPSRGWGPRSRRASPRAASTSSTGR